MPGHMVGMGMGPPPPAETRSMVWQIGSLGRWGRFGCKGAASLSGSSFRHHHGSTSAALHALSAASRRWGRAKKPFTHAFACPRRVWSCSSARTVQQLCLLWDTVNP